MPVARGALNVTGVTPRRMGVATAALVTWVLAWLRGTMTLLPGWIMVMLAPGLDVTTPALRPGLTPAPGLLTTAGFKLLTVGILQ